MNKKINYLLILTVLACTLVTAQNKKVNKALEEFENLSYDTAIDSYEDLINKGYSEEQIYKNLGLANYKNANYTETANWLSRLFKLNNSDVESNYVYMYAQSLKSSEEYEASNVWMQKYEAVKNTEIRAQKIAAKPDYLTEINEQSGRYDIKNLSINSAASDFAPSFKEDQLVFSTARDSGTTAKYVHSWNNKPFTNLYIATPSTDDDFGTPKKLSSLNKKTHETSAVFTKDGSTVYFTRNNSNNGNFSRDDKGVSRLKIYRAKLDDGIWKNISELPFNGDNFSTAHPTLSKDESKLYFASDMEGSYGASDIFVVTINEDGSFGTPKNLGNGINTEGRETFPFITEDNVLYFSSDGHPGLGGLDVFATQLGDSEILNIVNIGKPINSEQDDFSFIINSESRKGFFASNRAGGQGGDDIYGFIENEPINLHVKTLLSGIVSDEESGELLAAANVKMVDFEGKTVAETVSNENGVFALDDNFKNGTYTIIGIGEGYNRLETQVTVIRGQDKTALEIKLNKVLKEAPVGTDLAKFLNLKPVYFDLDKSNIRSDAATTLTAVLKYLEFYPNMRVQVQSHTDVKASKSYNNRLSNRRAKSTVSYLIENGINEERLTSKGFGESQLINDCTTLEKCTDEKHEENRRSEFIVLE
ncbi:OmpA family protein [Kriegella sp. EG-1]|nr:OmpA family protein [Flavobacteriaceae bacterium EG-1]